MGRVDETAGRCVPQIVGSPILVQQPEYFFRMADEISGEFEADQPIDAAADPLVQLHQPCGQHRFTDAFGGIPFEGEPHQLGRVSSLAQCRQQAVSQHFGPAAHERSLHVRHDDTHGLRTPCGR